MITRKADPSFPASVCSADPCCQVQKGSPPEEGQGVHKLAKQGGQTWLAGEDRTLDSETFRTPEAALGPVSERPGNAQLLEQRKDVVILQPHPGLECKLWGHAWPWEQAGVFEAKDGWDACAGYMFCLIPLSEHDPYRLPLMKDLRKS